MTEPAPDKIVSMLDFAAYSALLEEHMDPALKKKVEQWMPVLKAEKDTLPQVKEEYWVDDDQKVYTRASTLRSMFNTVSTVSKIPQEVRDLIGEMTTRVIDFLPDHDHRLPKLKPLV